MTEPFEDEPVTDTGPLVEGEDYYMDGPYFVFTANYHRKRGFCCGSRCKHCPYEDGELAELA